MMGDAGEFGPRMQIDRVARAAITKSNSNVPSSARARTRLSSTTASCQGAARCRWKFA
jgi:hypothetical protein